MNRIPSEDSVRLLDLAEQYRRAQALAESDRDRLDAALLDVVRRSRAGAGKTRAVQDARVEHDALAIPSDDLRLSRLVAEHDRAVVDATVRLGELGLASIDWSDEASAGQVREAVDALSGRQPSSVRQRPAAPGAQPVDDLDVSEVRARLQDMVPQATQDDAATIGGPSGLQM